jgi:hypothetical protein
MVAGKSRGGRHSARQATAQQEVVEAMRDLIHALLWAESVARGREEWANWEPEPLDLINCGDCCREFTLDNPAKTIATALKGPIRILCGDCSDWWQVHPNECFGLAFTLVPVAGNGRAQ